MAGREGSAPRQPDDPYPEVIGQALRHVVSGDQGAARATLAAIPFEIVPRRLVRGPAIPAVAAVFARDRYQCRYCGERTILTPVMRLLSRLFPDEFPMQQNWRADGTHPAFVSRSATLDHVVPVAGGGDPLDPANLVTACWGCNRRKGDLLLEELGWRLRAPADLAWSGLTELYEPAWIAAGRPELSGSEKAWMRAIRRYAGESVSLAPGP